MRKISLVLATLVLTACGGTDSAESSVVDEQVEKKANNPLAAEQQLIKDAEALQGMLEQDADRKKQAVDDAN